MSIILRAENITKEFHKKDPVLKGISMTLEEKAFTAVLGPSGSGKSTLLHVISGMLKPTSGIVFYKEKEVTKFTDHELADWKRNEVSNIFQSYMLLSNLTAGENIKIGISPKKESLPYERLTRILQIEDILDRFPSQLSGGQQQRVAIARAVIKKPSMLFCDEATGALDEENSKQVVGLLHHLKAAFGISILFITHNHEIAKTADRVITVKDGLLFSDTIIEKPIAASEMVWG